MDELGGYREFKEEGRVNCSNIHTGNKHTTTAKHLKKSISKNLFLKKVPITKHTQAKTAIRMAVIQ